MALVGSLPAVGDGGANGARGRTSSPLFGGWRRCSTGGTKGVRGGVAEGEGAFGPRLTDERGVMKSWRDFSGAAPSCHWMSGVRPGIVRPESNQTRTGLSPHHMKRLFRQSSSPAQESSPRQSSGRSRSRLHGTEPRQSRSSFGFNRQTPGWSVVCTMSFFVTPGRRGSHGRHGVGASFFDLPLFCYTLLVAFSLPEETSQGANEPITIRPLQSCDAGL